MRAVIVAQQRGVNLGVGPVAFQGSGTDSKIVAALQSRKSAGRLRIVAMASYPSSACLSRHGFVAPSTELILSCDAEKMKLCIGQGRWVNTDSTCNSSNVIVIPFRKKKTLQHNGRQLVRAWLRMRIEPTWQRRLAIVGQTSPAARLRTTE